MFSVLSILSFFADSTGMAFSTKPGLNVMASEQLSFGPELNTMASEHNSLGPATNRQKSLDLSAEPLSLTRQKLETLFDLMFDDSLVQSAPDVSTDSAAQTDNIPIPDTSVPTTTTVATDAPPIESPTTAEQTASDTDNTAEDLPQHEVPAIANYDGNAFFNPFAQTPTVPDLRRVVFSQFGSV